MNIIEMLCSGDETVMLRDRELIVNAVIEKLSNDRRIIPDEYGREPRTVIIARKYENDFTFRHYVDGIAEKMLEYFPNKEKIEAEATTQKLVENAVGDFINKIGETDTSIGDMAMSMGDTMPSGLGEGLQPMTNGTEPEPALA